MDERRIADGYFAPETGAVPVGARQLLIFCLVTAFALQTWLVYFDPLGSRDTLSPLAEGSGQMPALDLDTEERTALTAFLTELDATGISPPRLGHVVPPLELFVQWCAWS